MTMTYSDYLRLDQLLAAQAPVSDAHDEFLFIIQHQTSELWMRLVLKELEAARQALADSNFPPAFKMLTRVARIFEQLNNAWDVLRTMTPSEYTAFRGDLGGSSGFQSSQYRQIEFILGNRDRSWVAVHRETPGPAAALTEELARPSLYDVAVACAQAAGFTPPAAHADRDKTVPHMLEPGLVAIWQHVYANPERHWDLYQLAEKLVDLEDYFRRWRFNHVTTVERIIGSKKGTGGTGGVSYLKRMLAVELFPDLWHVRTEL